MILCLSACASGNRQKENQKTKEILEKVLNKEQNFSYKCLVFDKVTEENLKNFRFHTEYSALNSFVPKGYLYVDFDSDGIEELLIVDAYLKFFLILRCDNGNVNGYMLENLNLQGIKTDGSFMLEFYKAHTTVSRIQFEGLECIVSDVAYKNDTKKIYKLNGNLTTKDEVEKYFNSWNQSTTKVSWTKIS